MAPEQATMDRVEGDYAGAGRMTPREDVDCAVRALLSDHLLLVLLTASLLGNVYLGVRLRQSIEGPAPPETAVVGTAVPTFEALDTQGTKQTIRLSADRRRTVLFVYSPTCLWCKRTWPLFGEIARMRPNRFRFLTLSLGPSVVYRDSNVSAYASPSRSVVAALRLATVPKTILVGSDGRVEKEWVGAYTGRIKAEVEEYFGLSLPDLPETESRKLTPSGKERR
jgi:hypothetical protein